MQSIADGMAQIKELESQFTTKQMVVLPTHIESNGKVGIVLNNVKYEDATLMRSLLKSLSYSGVAKDITRLPIKESTSLLRSLIQDGKDMDIVYRSGTPVSFRNKTKSILPSTIVSKLDEISPNRWQFWLAKDHNSTMDVRLVESMKGFDVEARDEWRYGISVNRSLDKSKEYDIRCSIFRILCSNGMVSTKTSYSLKDVDETNLTVSLNQMLGVMDPIWNKMRGNITETKEIVIKDAVNRFDTVANMLKLNKPEKQIVRAKLDADMNFYKFYNTLTEYAQTLNLMRRRTIEIKSTEMVNQVSGVTRQPFYRALFS